MAGQAPFLLFTFDIRAQSEEFSSSNSMALIYLFLMVLATLSSAQISARGGALYHGRVTDIPNASPMAADTSELIVGGSKAPKNIRKRMAMAVTVTRGGEVFSCTGSVISKKFILCAAHCFIFGSGKRNRVWAKNSYVLIGEKGTDLKFFESPENKYKMKQVFIIKKFKPQSAFFRDDVALVELKEEIKNSQFFPFTLGEAPDAAQKKVIASGYGAKGTTKDKPRKLLAAKLVYQDWNTCTDELGFSSGIRQAESVCLTSKGFPNQAKTGICFGDSGGPVVFKSGGSFVQFGIASYFFGELCEAKGTVYVYQRVSFYKAKIEGKVLRNKNNGWKKLK